MQKFAILRLGIAVVGLLSVAGVSVAEPDPPAVRDEFPAKVQEALQIRDTGADVFPLLTAALRARKGGAAAFAKASDELVDGLLKGPTPYALLDQILPKLTIDYGSGAQTDIAGWQYGSSMEKVKLAHTLWNLAVSMEEKSPERASQVGRAALMLGAWNDFEAGWNVIDRVRQKPEDAKRLLKLPKEGFDQLRALAEKRSRQVDFSTEESHKAYRAIDKAAASKERRLAAGEVDQILAHFDKAFREGSPQYGDRHWTICMAWEFSNVLRSMKNDEGVAAVHKQLRKWNEDFKDKYIERWISQALTWEGSPPLGFLEEYELQPDRKLKVVQPDEKK